MKTRALLILAISCVFAISTHQLGATAASKAYSARDCSSRKVLAAVRKFDRSFVLTPDDPSITKILPKGNWICVFQTKAKGNATVQTIQVTGAPYSADQLRSFFEGEVRGYVERLGVGETQAWFYEANLGYEGPTTPYVDALAQIGSQLIAVQTEYPYKKSPQINGILKTLIKR